MNFSHFLMLISFLISTSVFAACCTCSSDYAQIVSKEGMYATSILNLTKEQENEYKKISDLKKREEFALANEKRTSELLSQARNIDSAGFALLMARIKAEGIVADSERMRMMTKGFEQSEREADEIIKGYADVTISQ